MWVILRLLIGIAILLIVELYFIRHVNLAIKLFFPDFYQKKFHLVRKVFLIWINLYPLALIFIFTYFAISGSYLTAPESKIIDYLLIYPFWIFFVLMIQCCLLFVPLDLIKIFSHLFIKKTRVHLLKIRSTLLFLIIGFFIFYIPIRIIYDYNAVSVRTVEYKKENLLPSLENFRIAFISDIQADHYTDQARLEKFVNTVNSLNPDLVLIAGDLITTGPDYITISGQEVGKIKSKYGVYSCVGDHDNWAYRNDYAKSVSEVEASLYANNVLMIDNGIRMIKIDSTEINVTFITNTYVQTIDSLTLDSLTSNNIGDFKVLLAHQPQPFIIDAAKKNSYNLYLAGHTHGGQITFVFPFVQLTPTMFETKYTRGDFWFGDMLLVVTRGLGMSLAPIRYNSTPEVTLITLQRK